MMIALLEYIDSIITIAKGAFRYINNCQCWHYLVLANLKELPKSKLIMYIGKFLKKKYFRKFE